MRVQWTDGTNWYDFTNSNITRTTTSLVPAAAIGIRAQAFGVAGTIDTASADPLYPSFLGNVANEAAMVALTDAIIGQSVRRTDTGTIWTLFAQPASTATNWVEAAGGSSSTSAGGGGGSDRTAVTYEVDPVNGGYRVLTENVSGFPWTLSYDAQGRLVTRTITGSTVAATISYDAAGFGTATGNYLFNDGVVATLAQMRALQALIIAGTVTGVSNGARMFITNVGYYNDVANSSDTLGAWCRWEGDEFCWEKPVVYMNDYASTYAPNGTSLSGALNAVSLPAGIMGKRSVAKIAFRIERVGGASSTMSSFVYLNGSNLYQTGALAATSPWTQVRKSLWNMGVLNAQQTENLASSDVATSSSTAMHTRSIDTSSTALDFDVRVQFGGTDAADNAKVWRLCVVVSDDFVMA